MNLNYNPCKIKFSSSSSLSLSLSKFLCVEVLILFHFRNIQTPSANLYWNKFCSNSPGYLNAFTFKDRLSTRSEREKMWSSLKI